MKVRDLIKLIESDGWRQIAQRGSHRQYKHHAKVGKVTVAGAPSDDVHPKDIVERIEASGTEEKVRDLMATTRKFLVVYEVGDNNLSGFAPDVSGVVATAATLEEMRKTMRDAVEFHLEGLAADGDAIPDAYNDKR